MKERRRKNRKVGTYIASRAMDRCDPPPFKQNAETKGISHGTNDPDDNVSQAWSYRCRRRAARQPRSAVVCEAPAGPLVAECPPAAVIVVTTRPAGHCSCSILLPRKQPA